MWEKDEGKERVDVAPGPLALTIAAFVTRC